jgi:iron complex transport system permease protein
MKYNYIKWTSFIALLAVLTVVAIFWSLSTGEMDITPSRLWQVLQEKSGIEYTILARIRIPRIVLALSTGGALGLTGAILQGIYRNPLVEPYTLGISGGAALGIAIVTVLGVQAALASYMLPLAGFLGSLLTIFLVYTLGMGIGKGAVSINRMLLIGVMISFVSSSAMMFLMAITTADNMQNIIFWMMGSLDEPNTLLIRLMAISALAGLAVSYIFARPLNALRLGGAKAQHLGVNAAFTIRTLFIIASLLTGISVAVAGIIGFVGLVIPHIIKHIVGPDYRFLLLGSFMGGGFFLLVCDVLARTVIAPNELPIGVITGMVGGLVFIAVLSKRGKGVA